jgi:zinc transporter ZupT
MLLAASIVSLLIGPLLFQITHVGSRALGFLEGFAFITICGLLCFGILPPSIASGGYGAWAFMLCGLAFPVILEKLFHQLARQVHLIILIVSIAGLAVHAAIDGVVLAAGAAPLAAATDAFWRVGHRHESEYLALAVVLHRFPLGLAVWYLLAPALGRRAALWVLGLLMVGTLLGFVFGQSIVATLPGNAVAWFQAFVAGSILHVVIYEPGHHQHGQEQKSERIEKWPDRIGIVCGLVLLYVYL